MQLQELTHKEVQGQKERRRPTCSKLLETVVDRQQTKPHAKE